VGANRATIVSQEIAKKKKRKNSQEGGPVWLGIRGKATRVKRTGSPRLERKSFLIFRQKEKGKILQGQEGEEAG